MTYHEWIETYKPVQNHIDTNANMDGTMFETYGAEHTYVLTVPRYNIWTLVETDNSFCIMNGYNWVNRLGYFVTEEPCTDDVTVRMGGL